MIKCEVDMFETAESNVTVKKKDGCYEIEAESDGENVIMYFTHGELQKLGEAIQGVIKWKD